MPHELTDLIDRSQFRTGLLVGLLVVAVCVAVTLLPPHGRGPLALAGSALWVGSMLAARYADVTFPHQAALFVGLVALWVAGVCVALTRLPFVARAVVFLPGALLVGEAFVPRGQPFVRPFLVVYIVIGAAATTSWPRWRAVADAGPLLMLLTVAGVYVCVPDIEHAALVLGVALTLGWTGWPTRFLTLGAGGASACVGLLAWVAGTDGVPRPGAVVGAAACLGVLAFVPLLEHTQVSLSSAGTGGTRPILTIVAVQVVLVTLCSRVAGLIDSAIVSGVIAAVVLAAAFLAVRTLYAPAAGGLSGTEG